MEHHANEAKTDRPGTLSVQQLNQPVVDLK